MQASTERLLGRLIGIPLIVLGLAFFVLPVLVWRNDGWTWDLTIFVVVLVFAAIGTGLLLTGRSFLKYKSDSAPPVKNPSRFDEGLAANRNRLTVIAEAGFVLSAAHLTAACFGKSWPPHRVWFLLEFGCIVLLLFAQKIASPKSANNADWMRVPKPVRIVLPPLRAMWGALLVLTALIPSWDMISGPHGETYRFALRLFVSGDIALLFALEALFFRYGDLVSNPT